MKKYHLRGTKSSVSLEISADSVVCVFVRLLEDLKVCHRGY